MCVCVCVGGGLLRLLNKAFYDSSSAYSTVVHLPLHCLLLSDIWDAYSNHFHSGYMYLQTNTLANDEMPHNGSALFANP